MKKKEEHQEDTSKIAGREFSFNDYKSNDETAEGLAITHEQISDNFAEGTIEGELQKENGEVVKIPRKEME
ncbi:YozQ family protein [Metabacillus arenae]|nr:YozQ family protein [Metabacillus arenae]